MAEHTSGPWEAVGAKEGMLPGHGDITSGTDPYPLIARVERFIGLWPDATDRYWRANARLIAAAPGLLEAAKALEQIFDAIDDGNISAGDHRVRRRLSDLRAAINKTERRS